MHTKLKGLYKICGCIFSVHFSTWNAHLQADEQSTLVVSFCTCGVGFINQLHLWAVVTCLAQAHLKPCHSRSSQEVQPEALPHPQDLRTGKGFPGLPDALELFSTSVSILSHGRVFLALKYTHYPIIHDGNPTWVWPALPRLQLQAAAPPQTQHCNGLVSHSAEIQGVLCPRYCCPNTSPWKALSGIWISTLLTTLYGVSEIPC